METTNWPVDDDGKPMAMVTAGGQEKIGLPNYSNIDIGPMTVTRFVRDDPDEIKEGLRTATLMWEEVAAEERDKVVEAVNQAKAGTILAG